MVHTRRALWSDEKKRKKTLKEKAPTKNVYFQHFEYPLTQSAQLSTLETGQTWSRRTKAKKPDFTFSFQFRGWTEWSSMCVNNRIPIAAGVEQLALQVSTGITSCVSWKSRVHGFVFSPVPISTTTVKYWFTILCSQ